MSVKEAATEAHRESVSTTVADTATFLEEVLGQKLVAYIVNVSDPRTVGRWAAGEREPRSPSEERLRNAAMVFRLLNTEESPHTVRAWFVGLNPQLDDRSPAEAIREGRLRDVLVAAKAFLAGG